MKTIQVTVICLIMASAVMSCNKQKRAPNSAASGSDLDDSLSKNNSDQSHSQKPRTQVAEGDLRRLLLALKRVHFAYDSSNLGPEARGALDEAAAKLRSLAEVDLYVDGHTDERGTTEYNVSLGERRAKMVVEYLKRAGIDTARLNAISFGEEQPMKMGASNRNYAFNRRVEFRIMKGDVEFVLEDGDPVDDQGSLLGNDKLAGEIEENEPENESENGTEF